MRVGQAFHDIQSLLEKARLLTFSSIFDEKIDNLAIEPINFVNSLKNYTIMYYKLYREKIMNILKLRNTDIIL